MAELGLPFQGSIWWWTEASYGGGESGTTNAVSCKVLDARPGINDKHKPLRGIDGPQVCELYEQATDHTFHLEYIPQCDDTLIEAVVDRLTTGKLNSLSFCLGTNVLNAGSDKSYYYLTGCKPKTVRISAAFNDTYKISIDFSVKSGVSNTAATGSAPAALTGAYLGFNVGGAIKKDGASFAYITDSIDITIDHHITDKFDHDSLVKQYAIEGAIDIDGTIDISLDEGGKDHWGEVLNQVEFDVVIDLGGSGCPRLTINNCKWKSGEFDKNTGDEPMTDSAPFTAHPATFTEARTIVSATP